MKGKHLPENMRVAEKKDYITQIELLKNEVEILKRAVGASAEEVQRLANSSDGTVRMIR